MKLNQLFEKGTFVTTGEVGPVKGAVNREKPLESSCFKQAAELSDYVHAVNVTDNQSAVMRLGSLAPSIRLKNNGIEPIYQMTCRDRNRLALQSDLLTAYSLGIDNVLLLTGDHIQLGDHKEAKPVFDLDSVQLLKMARGLEAGIDISGNQLENSIDMSFGAVVNPNFEPLELAMIKMQKKVDAGAQFFQTQAVYDVKTLEVFMNQAQKFNVPVQAGIVVIKSPQMGRFMNNHISGITVPDEWIEQIGSVDEKDRKQKAAQMTAAFISQIKEMVQGIHIMPLGWTDIVPGIMNQAGLEKE